VTKPPPGNPARVASVMADRLCPWTLYVIEIMAVVTTVFGFSFVFLGMIIGYGLNSFGYIAGGVLGFFGGHCLFEMPLTSQYIIAVFDLFGYAQLSLHEIKKKQTLFEKRFRLKGDHDEDWFFEQIKNAVPLLMLKISELMLLGPTLAAAWAVICLLVALLEGFGTYAYWALFILLLEVMAWLAVSIIVLWGVIKPTLYKGIMPYVDDYLNFLRWQTSVDVRQKRPPAAAPTSGGGGQTFDKKPDPTASQATRAKQMSTAQTAKGVPTQAPAPTPPPQSLGASQANGNAGKKRSSGKKPEGGDPPPARASSGSLL